MKLDHDIENHAVTEQMPLLFLGHGSPMNAIEENEFVEGFRDIAKTIPMPMAILCISAHWETRGTLVTAMETPKTIHDFGGFPRSLYEVQYPAPGSPELAHEIKKIITKTSLELDYSWGLDHGTWSVIKHLYPEAKVPVVQLSLDRGKFPEFHYELAKELISLRRRGVLIVGSGNIVHNLGILDWDRPDGGYDWAVNANNLLKKLIMADDHSQLIHYRELGEEIRLSIPTPEHYLPLLYILGLKEENETITFFNDKLVMGSLSMTSLKIDKSDVFTHSLRSGV